MGTDFSSLLGDLENSLGVNLTVHDWFRLASLPASVATHNHPFCGKIKETHESDCVAWCREKTSRECTRFPAGRIQKCPFGALEIQVPLHYGGRIYGILFAGSFPDGYDSVRLESLQRSLCLLAGPLAERLACQADPGEISRKEMILDWLGKCENHSLGQLAYEMGLSPDRIRHVVRELFGKSFTDLVLEQQMTRAARILIESNKTITWIAMEQGYDDPLYFSRRFRKVMKMSPRRFREQNRLSP